MAGMASMAAFLDMNERRLKMESVIYCRVSTSNQADRGFSLPTQIEACNQYANQKGYHVLEVFQDDFTGASLDRPGLDALRKFVDENEVKIVIVYDIDRLARKAIYQMLIEEEFEKKGVRIEYVRGQYADSDEGRLQKQIRASIAEYEKAKIIERGRRGKYGKAKSGSVVVGGRPPYGYRTNQEGNRRWFEVIEDEAKIVKLIFHLYVSGDGGNHPLSQNRIAAKLTEMKIPTRGDKTSHVSKKYPKYTWRPATIRSILNQEAYIGIWYFGKTRMKNGKQIPKPRSEWIPIDVPQIIEKEHFDKAQQIMKINTEMSRRNTKNKYLLRSRLKCGNCGYSYVGKTRRPNHQYYICKGKEQTPLKVCNMPNFRLERVNNAVWSWIEGMILDPDNLVLGLKENQKSSERLNNHLKSQIQIIDDQLTLNKEKMDKLIDLYLEDSFPREMIASRRKELEDTILQLQIQKDKIRKDMTFDSLTDDQILELEDFVQLVAEGIRIADFDTKRRIIDLLDVRGKLAIENGKKVVHVTCKLEKQQPSLVVTWPLSNTGERKIVP